MKKWFVILSVLIAMVLFPSLSIAKSPYNKGPAIDSATELQITSLTKMYKQYITAEQYKKAIEAAQKIVQLMPDNPESHFILGLGYTLDNNYEEAINSLQKSVQMNPGKFDYNHYLGVAYNKNNNQPMAIKYFNNALNIDPSNLKNLQSLGNAYFKTNDYTNALNIYKKVVKITPKEVVYCTLLGLSYEKLKNDKAALQTLETCLNIDPTNEDALTVAAELALREEEWEKSKDLYTKVKKYYPKYATQVDNKLTLISQKQQIPASDKKISNKKSKKNKTEEEHIYYVSKTMSQSPSSIDIALSTPLYTGAINKVSTSGAEFSNQQKLLTTNITNQIDSLTTKLLQTKKLNKDFQSSVTNRVVLWKTYYDKDKKMALVYNTEKELFNFSLMLQLKEDNKWAIIDSVLEELAQLKQSDSSSINESIRKSYLYSSLLILYVDLAEFYKEKYKDLLFTVNINNALETNPSLGVKLLPEIINKLKSLNTDQLNQSKQLMFDLATVSEELSILGNQSKELRDIYHQMDKYSLSEIEQLISGMEQNITKAKTLSANPDDQLITDMLPTMESYLAAYKEIKDKLSAKILVYEMSEAVIANKKGENTITLASIDHSIPSLAYSLSLTENIGVAWETLKGTVKTVATSASATKDYLKAKGKEYIIDKPKAIRQYGLFTDKYNNWSKEYDKKMDVEGGPSIVKTFWEPVVKTAITGESQKTYKESMEFIGDGVNLAYSTTKSGVTLVSSSVDKLTAKGADTIYGTDTAKDINITKDVIDTFLLDQTAKSLDKSRVPFGLTYALANAGTKKLADITYGENDTNAYVKKDIIEPLSKWYGNEKSTVGQEAIHQAGTSLDDFEKGVASYLGNDTQVSNALLNLATIGTWDVMKGSNKLMDKSATTNEQAFALLDLVGGVNSMKNIPQVSDKFIQLKKSVKEGFDDFFEKGALKAEKNIALKDLVRTKTDLQKALKEGTDWKIDMYEKRMYEVQSKMDALSQQINNKVSKNIADVPEKVLNSKEMKELAVKSFEDIPDKSIVRSVFEEGMNGTASNYGKNEAQTAVKNKLIETYDDHINTSLKTTSDTVRSQLADSFKKSPEYENEPDLATKYSSKPDNKDTTTLTKQTEKTENASSLDKPYSTLEKQEPYSNQETKPYQTQNQYDTNQNKHSWNDPYKTKKTDSSLDKPYSSIEKQQPYTNTQTKPYPTQKQYDANQNKQSWNTPYKRTKTNSTLNKPYTTQQKTTVRKTNSYNTQKTTKPNTYYKPVATPTPAPKPVAKKKPLVVPQICYQSTYNWIPKGLCARAWYDVNGNLALFHRKVGEYVRQYNIKRP